MARFFGLRGTNLGFAVSTVCGLCFFVFGYSQGDFGGLLTQRNFLDQFPEIDYLSEFSSHRARILGIAVATWNIGCFASAILTIFLGDFLGRRKTLMLGITLWVIGEAIQASSFSFGQLIAGRFIAGFGNGFTTATVPAYQAECVKSHRKGTILMVTAGAFIAAGLSLSYWMSFAFSYIEHSSVSWRAPIAIQCPFAVVAFIMLLWLPESPRWLILTGREQEALTVLGALNDIDPESEDVRDEFLQIKDAILALSSASTKGVFSNTETRHFHRAVLAFFIQVFQQMTGINLFMQYLAVMFIMETGYDAGLARLLAGCASTSFFIASFVAIVGIDRFWGRRSLMMFGSAGMGLCMVLLCVLVYLYDEHQVYGTNTAAAVFIFLFAAFFAIGWQGMAWLYQVEVVPLRIRGPANALSTAANWLINFVVVLITPIAFHNIGWRTYIIFAASNAAILPLIYFFYPETAYRSLEEVSVLFHLASQTKHPYLSVVRIAREEPLWFGRKGEKDFEYGNSEWHKRFAGWSGSGSGTGSSFQEKEKDGEETLATSRRESGVSPVSTDPSGPLSSGDSSHRQMVRRSSSQPPPHHPSTSTESSSGMVPREAGIVTSRPSSRSRSFSKPSYSSAGYYYTDAASAPPTTDMDSIAASFADLAPPPPLFAAESRSRSVNSGRPSSEITRGPVPQLRPGMRRTGSGRETYFPDGESYARLDLAGEDEDEDFEGVVLDPGLVPEGIVVHREPDPDGRARRRTSSAGRASAAAGVGGGRVIFPVAGMDGEFTDEAGRRYRFSAITERSERSSVPVSRARQSSRESAGGGGVVGGRAVGRRSGSAHSGFLARDAGMGY